MAEPPPMAAPPPRTRRRVAPCHPPPDSTRVVVAAVGTVTSACHSVTAAVSQHGDDLIAPTIPTPVQLFAADYDAADGCLLSIDPHSDAAAISAASKKRGEPTTTPSPASSRPNPKRFATPATWSPPKPPPRWLSRADRQGGGRRPSRGMTHAGRHHAGGASVVTSRSAAAAVTATVAVASLRPPLRWRRIPAATFSNFRLLCIACCGRPKPTQ